MPSTKEIEQFRKYLNRTLREDFLEDLKKDEAVLHGPIEATTAEAAELRNALAASETGGADPASEISPEVSEADTDSRESAPDLSTLIDAVQSDVDINSLHFDDTDRNLFDKDSAPESDIAADSGDLSSFLDMDWSKDPVTEESKASDDAVSGTDDFSIPDSFSETDSFDDSVLKVADFEDGPDALPEQENSASLSESTGPGSFFTSGLTHDSDGGSSDDWDEGMFSFSTPEDAVADQTAETGENTDSGSNTDDSGIVDTGWAPTDLGEVPESFETISADDNLEFDDMPKFANEDDEEGQASFEEKFGEKKKTAKKKKVHYSLSERESEVIFNYLSEFPRNVKIICQRFIASEENDPDDVIALIELLKAEESIKVIVRFLEEKTGTRISIPRGFEKINGKAYWEKINSPAYIFRTKILPVIIKSTIAGLFALFTVAVSVLLFIPAARGSYVYRSGYNDIGAEEYDSSVEKFDKAFRIWPSRGWSYKYAEKYIEKRQYILAEQIYDNLLADDYRPYDKKGRLDYCRFESSILGNYQKADSIIQTYLDYDRTDAEAHLEAARNFLRWSYFDTDRLESARIEIVAAGENSKYTDEIMFEMLHYMILSDRYDDVCQMWASYRDKPRKKIDPVIFGKLAGYYIDREEKESANAVIKRIYRQDEDNRDAHFQWARLSRIESEWTSMETAANRVLYQISQLPYLTRDTLSMKILSLNMKAIAEYKKSEYLLMQRDLEEGIGLYESALKRNILKKEPVYGELYYHLGDLFYYTAEEYDSAFALYRKAEESLFHNADIVYKKGYIEYKRGNYRSALLEFADAASTFSSNPNLMYATGNTFFRRNDFFSALAQYYHTADLLEKQKNSIRGYDPQTRIAHYRTVEGLSMIYNNIGATLYGIYRTTGDHSKYVQALANLQKATEYRDLLLRDRSTLEGLNLEGSVSRVNTQLLLESDNMKAVLYPATAESVRIYEELPKDMETDIFGFY